MLGKKINTIAVLAIAFIASALVFAVAPSRLYAQSNGSIQWVPFTVGHVSGQDTSQVNIYTTDGSFMVSNVPGDQTTTVHDKKTGEDRIETPVFGVSSENPAGDAQTWSGALEPGAYFVGAGDLSSLSISGASVSYTPPATPSAPVATKAPAPVTQPKTAPANTSQPAANPSDQTQWYSLTIGSIKNHDTSQVNIYMTNGTFVVSNAPSDQMTTVREKDGNNQTQTPVFGRSSENEAGNAQIWLGALIPGAYFVGVNGDVSTLSIWGDAVNYAPLQASAH